MNKYYTIKKITLLFIVIILSNNIIISQNSEEAVKLLNKVSENIKSYDNIYINYTYTLFNLEEDINQINKGSFVTEDDKWKFVMLDVTRIFDGDKLYTISPDDEEVTISTQNPDDESTITPNKMLYFYEEGYNFEMDIVQYVGRKKIQYVKLIPMDSDAEIKYILMGIDVEFNQIYKVIETGINDTQTTIAIIDFEVNLPLEESLFVFDEEKYFEELNYYENIID
jgi:outer membrane lipoprotein-sorting protein